MTNGCTLHETLATVVARRSTTPVEARGLKRENTMVIRFLVDREAKVDVPDYMRICCARVKRLYGLSAHNFCSFEVLDSDLCRGEESEQQQPRRHQQKIVES